MWKIRPATPEDIIEISSRIRDADAREIYLSTGKDPLTCLQLAVSLPSLGSWVGVYNGSPEVLFGCTYTPDPSLGCPWMVSTNILNKSPREFVRISRSWVRWFSENFPLLKNFVSQDNTIHIRWLKWCGFKFVKLHPEFGTSRTPFWEFVMEQKEI